MKPKCPRSIERYAIKLRDEAKRQGWDYLNLVWGDETAEGGDGLIGLTGGWPDELAHWREDEKGDLV